MLVFFDTVNYSKSNFSTIMKKGILISLILLIGSLVAAQDVDRGYLEAYPKIGNGYS